MKKDKRPDPKPRKNAQLWQSYLYYDELVEMRKRHKLRLDSIKKGKSNFNASFEEGTIDSLDAPIKLAKEVMIKWGKSTGEIWYWLGYIKGLKAGTLAAQLLAQIDDIGKFATVSKLWRYSGYAVINGKIDRRKQGELSHYNARLKSIVYLIVEQFIRHQTPVYSDLYYEKKSEYRRKYPEKIKGKNGKWKYTDAHINNMTYRKVAKVFLQHLWVKWREFEGLPVTRPYIEAIMGHENIIRADSIVKMVRSG